ncbi:MAG TPA: 30S ribosomal protein S20 [Tepidisphaeraceae bacterium]
MAHSLSAKKRIRQGEKRQARNKARKETLKVETKAFNAALTGGNAAEATKALGALVSTLDRVKLKSTIHPNTAARRRSRATKKLNALTAKAGTKA